MQEKEIDLIPCVLTDGTDYKRNRTSIYRAKRQIKRLINANIHQYKERDKFLTLTFEDNPTREEVIYRFKIFNKRLKRKYPDYKYLGVIERGTHGEEKLHLHVLFFGLPFIHVTKFEEIWSYGFVYVNAVTQYFDLANYIIKYITKLLQDCTTIGKGKNFYLCSRGLLKPDELFMCEEEFENYIDVMENDVNYRCVFENGFESKHVGEFEYYKFVKPYEFNEEDALYELKDE